VSATEYRIYFDAVGVVWADDVEDVKRQLVTALRPPNGPVIDLSPVAVQVVVDGDRPAARL
jgi:hypothetical protein